MGPRTRIGMAGALACGVAIAAVSIGRSGDEKSPSGPYIAIGDSYTSGPKIPPQTGSPAGCARSGRNYPAMVAKKLDIKAADFRDVSCTGATVADLAAPQPTENGTNPAQLAALSITTRLITLGIGGNDIGFSSIIAKCVTTGLLFRMADNIADISAKAPCKEKYTAGGSDQVAQKIRTLGEQLARTLNEIKHRAPEARVYVVGYPAILPVKGADCGRDMPLAPDDVTFLHQKEQQLNTMLRERASAAGATYVDTFTPSLGHHACSQSATRWIEPLNPSSPAAVLHPNERGERGMATAILGALKA